VQDKSRAQKTDALHNVRRHASLVRVCLPGQHGRKQREKRGAHADQQVRPNPGSLAAQLPFQPHQAPQNACHYQAANGSVHHDQLLDLVKMEGLRDL